MFTLNANFGFSYMFIKLFTGLYGKPGKREWENPCQKCGYVEEIYPSKSERKEPNQIDEFCHVHYETPYYHCDDKEQVVMCEIRKCLFTVECFTL